MPRLLTLLPAACAALALYLGQAGLAEARTYTPARCMDRCMTHCHLPQGYRYCRLNCEVSCGLRPYPW